MAARMAPRTTSSTNLSRAPARPLDGKLAIVTGASRGIGAAIAQNLASKGCALVLNYTSDKSGEQTERLSQELQREFSIVVLVVQADLGAKTGPAHLISTSKNHFSHPKTSRFQIDIIVNNAGVSNDSRIEDVSIEDFDFQYRINVLGPLLLMQAALPYLPTDRSGRIVNLSSVSSSMGFVSQSIYGGTKAALEAMTRTWSRELAERCTVNAINPGPVLTDMWAGTSPAFKESARPYVEISPLQAVRPGVDSEELVKDAKIAGGRPAYTGEIAGVVGMLTSVESAWITGQVICANGGMRMAI
ncbi:MAG: hypothetical protein M1818_005355 [Claussenomyces sp. TS43310]|nr:MAG: hypothetical protein M1818_005355 [Claussenomyces sp. TS43310]